MLFLQLPVLLLPAWLPARPAGGGDEPVYGAAPPSLVAHREAQAYRRFFLEPLTYRGPGREEAAPVGLESIAIGVVAPLEGAPDEAMGRSLLRGVELAMAEANATGGLGGTPFRLVVRNDQAIWGSSANTLVDLRYREGVWAVIGSLDSNSTHVALRVALKCEVPIVNVGASDPTVTETGIPWLVRLTPDDRQVGYRLAQELFVAAKRTRVAVLRSSDRYGRMGISEFRDAAMRLGHPLAQEVLFEPGGVEGLDDKLERIARARPDALVIWAKSRDAGRAVRRARELGIEVPLYGPSRLVSDAFLEAAGPAAEGLHAAAWTHPERYSSGPWKSFRERFVERYDLEPDEFAAYGHDAGALVVEKIRAAGLNRARLRDALLEVRERAGIAGDMRFDPTSNNLAPLTLVRVQGGRFVLAD